MTRLCEQTLVIACILIALSSLSICETNYTTIYTELFAGKQHLIKWKSGSAIISLIKEYDEVEKYFPFFTFKRYFGCIHTESVKIPGLIFIDQNIIGKTTVNPVVGNKEETKCRGTEWWISESFSTRFCVAYELRWSDGAISQDFVCNGMYKEFGDGIMITIKPIVATESTYRFNNYTCEVYTHIDTGCEDLVTPEYCTRCSTFTTITKPKSIKGELVDDKCRVPTDKKPFLNILVRSELRNDYLSEDFKDGNSEGNSTQHAGIIERPIGICNTNLLYETIDELCTTNKVKLYKYDYLLDGCHIIQVPIQSDPFLKQNSLYIIKQTETNYPAIYYIDPTNSTLLNTCTDTTSQRRDVLNVLGLLQPDGKVSYKNCTENPDLIGCLTRKNITTSISNNNGDIIKIGSSTVTTVELIFIILTSLFGVVTAIIIFGLIIIGIVILYFMKPSSENKMYNNNMYDSYH